MALSSISSDVSRRGSTIVQPYLNSLTWPEVTKKTQIAACALVFLAMVYSEDVGAGLRTALPNHSIAGSKTFEGPGNHCIYIDDSRYLMNSGGFQVGHWGMVASKLVGAIHRAQIQGMPVRIIFRDFALSPRRLRLLEQTVLTNAYFDVSMRVLSAHTGVNLSSSFGSVPPGGFCRNEKLLRFDAGSAPFDDSWISGRSSRFSTEAAKLLKCDNTVSDDVLLYNRVGTRRIVNYAAIAEQLFGHGLVTKVLTPNELSVEDQICEMTKKRKLIITPHGGQQGSLIFKHKDTGVVVISPEHALLECYRYVVEEEGVWIAVRGGRVWACASDVCSKQENAWLDENYDKKRIIDARKKSISVPRDALDRIVKIAGLP